MGARSAYTFSPPPGPRPPLSESPKWSNVSLSIGRRELGAASSFDAATACCSRFLRARCASAPRQRAGGGDAARESSGHAPDEAAAHYLLK